MVENTMEDSKKPELKGMNIGIGELKIGGFVMTSIGLGSCIAVVLHDKKKAVGGVAHVMLPNSNDKKDRPGKYADTAVPELLGELIAEGSNKRDIIAKIAGGSSMFRQFKGNLDIGGRNIEAVKEALNMNRIPLEGEDTGGNVGRSIMYDPGQSGVIVIRRADGTCINI
ncbi:chemotaxis protein CheD [Methanolacinia petrolearia]|uniref:chemotaxis protein CheD n=1 Tax=Methanolacinia petrolearia TaxID=54120 RepID=UPI003BA8AD9B